MAWLTTQRSSDVLRRRIPLQSIRYFKVNFPPKQELRSFLHCSLIYRDFLSIRLASLNNSLDDAVGYLI